jgi:hypothetical protein
MRDEFYRFLSDPELVDFIEQGKVSNDILDVITLSENQHSDMLAWCLTPGEGHGQGDAVIKDFLEAAHRESDAAIYDNKIFFRKWTPGKVRASSFGAAFVTREFGVDLKDAEKNKIGKGRLDLFLVDPQNKLLIAIENKAGAKLNEGQLVGYQKAVRSKFKGSLFKGYDFAFVVLDRDLASYTDDHIETLGHRWALLDYTWLEASANRARLQVERNNHAAQLLVAYCQKQTDWESTSEELLSELAGDIAERHPEVMAKLRNLRGDDVSKWTPNGMSGPEGELALFRAQHFRLCALLTGSQGIASLQRKIVNALDISHADIFASRSWLMFATPDMAELTDDDDFWALAINIFRQAKSSDDKPCYTVRVIWRRDYFFAHCGGEAAIREHFAAQLPGLTRFGSASVRRIVIARDLDSSAALKRAVALANQLSASVSDWRAANTQT